MIDAKEERVCHESGLLEKLVCRTCCHEDDSFVQMDLVCVVVHINIGFHDGGTHILVHILEK
jgi:hypothetical protein